MSIPHSGEVVPPEAFWLKGLSEPILMCDVDRYVDRLYQPVLKKLNISHVIAQTHRYVVDLNRLPDDIDADSVKGNKNPSGRFPIGLHWSRTTKGDRLMEYPIDLKLHFELLNKYFWPFHHEIEMQYKERFSQGFGNVYQLDAHSMPSLGTEVHKDPGKYRPEIVVSDQNGISCSSEFKNLVIESYKKAGFEVAYNFPYVGGRVTQTYGKPERGQHCIQVELNRDLYMNESTKGLIDEKSSSVAVKIERAVANIMEHLKEMKK
ncbi:MAG: N-formylglutamate amidohydrolase [Bdellovibrionales bacterium]|nr:N-formylglutamate amidohydrolase [Bdellovibrionales bacterium]